MLCSNGEAVGNIFYLHQVLFYHSCKGKDGCMWCLMSCCFPWVASSIFRTAARDRYGIEVSCHKLMSHDMMSCVTNLCHASRRARRWLTGAWASAVDPWLSVRQRRSTRRETTRETEKMTRSFHSYFMCQINFKFNENFSAGAMSQAYFPTQTALFD